VGNFPHLRLWVVGVTAWRELVDELRARVADLLERLDRADRRADAMETERARLLALVETLAVREPQDAQEQTGDDARRPRRRGLLDLLLGR
jgi:hypothetical protein